MEGKLGRWAAGSRAVRLRTRIADVVDNRATRGIAGSGEGQGNPSTARQGDERCARLSSSAPGTSNSSIEWEAWALNHHVLARLCTSHCHHTEPGQDSLAFSSDFMAWKSTRHEACPLQPGDSPFLHCDILFQKRGQHQVTQEKPRGTLKGQESKPKDHSSNVLPSPGWRDRSPKVYVMKLMTKNNINLKGIFEFWVESRCQLLESKCYILSSLTKISNVVETLKPTELMAKIHLDPTKPRLL